MNTEIFTEEKTFYNELETMIYNGTDKELLEFVNNNFYKKRVDKVLEYKRNLNVLKDMDLELKSTAVARMAYLEESKDALKSISFVSGIAIVLITTYISFAETLDGFEKVSPALHFLSIFVLFSIFTTVIVKSRQDKSLIIFFGNLIKSLCK